MNYVKWPVCRRGDCDLFTPEVGSQFLLMVSVTTATGRLRQSPRGRTLRHCPRPRVGPRCPAQGIAPHAEMPKSLSQLQEESCRRGHAEPQLTVSRLASGVTRAVGRGRP